MSTADDLRAGIESFRNDAHRPRDRARELYEETLWRYDFCQKELKLDETLELLCSVGTRTFSVRMLSYISPDFISIESTGADGDRMNTVAPVEQISFTIVVSKRGSEEPKPEIGFGGAASQR